MLQRFEKRLEGLVEGAFAKVFKGVVHPVEILNAMQREAEAHKAILAGGRTLVPNRYVIDLSPYDHSRLAPYAAALAQELAQSQAEFIGEQGWTVYGDVIVEIERGDGLDTGMFRVTAEVYTGGDPQTTQSSPYDVPGLVLGGPPRASTARLVTNDGRTYPLSIEDPDGHGLCTISVYLGNEEGAADVEVALAALLASIGCELSADGPAVIGSWFRRFVGRTEKIAESDDLAYALTRIERALELRTLDKPQSDVDWAQANSVATLIGALQAQPNALIQIGSLFLIKVDGTIAVRNLSQRELAFLERNSGMLTSPQKFLSALDRFANDRKEADERSIGPAPADHLPLRLAGAGVGPLRRGRGPARPRSGRLWNGMERVP